MTSAISNFASRLESAIGRSHVFSDPALCSEYVVDERTPSAVAKPASAEEVAEIVRFAALEKLSLIPCGHRTKLRIGMPPSRYDLALDMTGLHQIAHYDPGDLTVSVDAGANFNDLAAPLYQQKQFLPLPVPFYFESTIGGIIASGVDSSLRHAYGTARDFLIGAEFVDGTGRLCKSGGRVVKNVTGYDLHKLLIGSLGTLAVITRLNFRTFPLAPASRGFVLSFPAPDNALAFSKLIERSPLGPASIDVVSPQCDRASSEFARIEALREAKHSPLITLNETEGADLWHYLGQSIPLLLGASPENAIFKITILPSRLAPLLEQLRVLALQASLCHAILARACGVIYFALIPSSGEQASLDSDPFRRLAGASSAVFSLCARENASATLPWCPTQLKGEVNVWGLALQTPVPGRPAPTSAVSSATPSVPLTELALMRRLKSAFDPQNLFAPGRLFS